MRKIDESKKDVVLDCLKQSGGIIYVACDAAGISRSTFNKWCREDVAFAEAVENVKEAQIDYVESKLMEQINAHDTTAILFYLKTRGKKRGWTEKVLPPEQPQLPAKPAEASNRVKMRIKHKKDYIVKILRKEGKYTGELSHQVGLTAELLVRKEIVAEQIFDENYTPINTEISREGNVRELVNPAEKLYLDLVQQSQRALRALGMNTDAKERTVEADGFTELFNELKPKDD